MDALSIMRIAGIVIITSSVAMRLQIGHFLNVIKVSANGLGHEARSSFRIVNWFQASVIIELASKVWSYIASLHVPISVAVHPFVRPARHKARFRIWLRHPGLKALQRSSGFFKLPPLFLPGPVKLLRDIVQLVGVEAGLAEQDFTLKKGDYVSDAISHWNPLRLRR